MRLCHGCAFKEHTYRERERERNGCVLKPPKKSVFGLCIYACVNLFLSLYMYIYIYMYKIYVRCPFDRRVKTYKEGKHSLPNK